MAKQRNRVGNAFGEVLRRARLDNEMTQEVLGEAADFKPAYISFMESGRRQPTITAIIALEQSLGLAPGELVQRTVKAMRGKKLAKGKE